MRHDYGAPEDSSIGRAYDPMLLRRIFAYALNYRRMIITSIFFVLIMTILDLSLPYLTKIAIDHYIVPDFHARDSEQALDSPRVRVVKIKKTDTEAIRIVNLYPQFFTEYPDSYHISYSDLSKFSSHELRTLRKTDLSGLSIVALIFLIAVSMNVVLTFYQKLSMEIAGHKMMHDLRMDLYRHIQTLSVSFFTRRPVAQLVTRMTNDIQKMHDLFTSVISFLFKDFLMLIGIGVILLFLDMALALISFLVMPLVVVSACCFEYYIRDVFRQIKIKVSEINSRFSEAISGMKVIQIFQKEENNFKSFYKLNNDKYILGIRQINGFALFMPFIDLMGTISLSLAVYFGGRRILSETMTLGDLVAFIHYIKMLFRPIRDLAEKYNILQNAMASAERVFEMLDNNEKEKYEDMQSNVKNIYSVNDIYKIRKVEFDRVHFHYNSGEDILCDVSFTINAGEKLSIVGPTGSGKTTLINLLLKFYVPSSGEIYIGNSNLKEIPLNELRSRIALVTQDPFLFTGTIRENIQMGELIVSEKQMDEILNTSHLTSIISKMPDGLDTRILEGGKSLSSGERQLISIARALCRNAELILMDEATSYIDSHTEYFLKTAIEKLVRERTSIVVAHRLLTARSADKILVMNRGRIIECGNHDDLMEKGGFYFNLNRIMSNSSFGMKEKV